jgi:hypothetical protein
MPCRQYLLSRLPVYTLVEVMQRQADLLPKKKFSLD